MGPAVRVAAQTCAGNQRGVHVATARGPGGSSDARRRRQRGRCGHRHRDRLDGGGAGLQRHRLRRLRHRLGWSATARAERVGTLARRMDARVFRRRRRSRRSAGIRSPSPAPCRRGSSCMPSSESSRSSGSLSRQSPTAATGFWSHRRSPSSGRRKSRCSSPSQDSPRHSCPAAGRRSPANWSHCPTTPPRSR